MARFSEMTIAELTESATYVPQSYESAVTRENLSNARKALASRAGSIPVVTNTEKVHPGRWQGGRWVMVCGCRSNSFVSPVNPDVAVTCGRA